MGTGGSRMRPFWEDVGARLGTPPGDREAAIARHRIIVGGRDDLARHLECCACHRVFDAHVDELFLLTVSVGDSDKGDTESDRTAHRSCYCGACAPLTGLLGGGRLPLA